MLSIGAMKSGQDAYCQNLAREDYFLEGGEPPGRWLGEGTRKLGITRTVGGHELSLLFRGYSPAGRKLVQNAGKDNRQPGWDLTFSAPKSVSILSSQAGSHEQKEVADAHAEAVSAAVRLLESHYSYSRVGKGGLERTAVSLVVAVFEHSCSRAFDPQLHMHCLVMNLGVDVGGCVRSILSKPFYEAKMLAGAFYRVELAYQLQQRLRVEIERPLKADGEPVPWFEIKGIPESLLKHFSKRRAAIEEQRGARGVESASAAALATLSTRNAKSIIPPRTELHERWRAEGTAVGFSPESVFKCNETSSRLPETVIHESAANAAQALTSTENVFSREELLQKVLESLPGSFPAAQIISKTNDELCSNKTFESLGVRDGNEAWTTSEVLLEKDLIQAVDALRTRVFSGVSTDIVDSVLKADRVRLGSSFRLDDEQQAAVRYIAKGKESIKVVSGFAGTGKTDMLAAAKEALEMGGYRVIGTALASVAARSLQEKTGIHSATVRAREFQLYPTLKHRLKHHAEQLLRAAVGKSTFRLEPLAIYSRTVLVIDEAGMVGTRDFTLLASAVVESGGSLVAIGDERQLSSIERGGAFAKLVRDVAGFRLTEIRRQTDERDRAAVKDLAAGNAEAALSHYAAKGNLCVAKNRAHAEEKLISDWARNGGTKTPGEHKIFAGTRAEVARLNALAQWERVKAGDVSPDERVEHEGQVFMLGDRVRFNASLRTRGIEKGQSATVIAVKDSLAGRYVAVSICDELPTFSERARIALKHHASLLIRAAVGKKTERLSPRRDVVLVPLKSLNPLAKTYAGLSLDYAMTTQLGQGQTVTNAYVLLGGKMGDRELSYVQGSRHKENLHLYTSEVEAGRRLTDVARAVRPVEERSMSPGDDVPEYSSVVMQMNISRAMELASEVRAAPILQNKEHQHAI